MASLFSRGALAACCGDSRQDAWSSGGGRGEGGVDQAGGSEAVEKEHSSKTHILKKLLGFYLIY